MPVDLRYDAFLISKMGENLLLLGVIYISVSKVFDKVSSNIALAVSIFGLQYIIKILMPDLVGNQGWTVFGLILGRFLGIYHPEVEDNKPLGFVRILFAVLALLILITCFSPKPFG